jgi:uncharacterized protein DUF3883
LESALTITGAKVARPTKGELCADIARALRIPEPASSSGSSIDSSFLDNIHSALAGGPSGGTDTYRKTERVLQRLGLTYDPYWDTSEAAPDGGGTVTTRAFSRIRTAVTGIPRCFIINTTDAPVGAKWETDRTAVYRYDDTVSGRKPFTEAGPGSRIVHYSTNKSSSNKMRFVAHAEVNYIASGWPGPWEARFSQYEELPTPVPVALVDIPGWNRQNAIIEITWHTYRAVVAAGGVEQDRVTDFVGADAGGDVVAERVKIDFSYRAPLALYIPDDLPGGHMPAIAPRSPQYKEAPSRLYGTGAASSGPRTPAERRRDKLAEERAVELATAALQADGWAVLADRQKEGVGYDLEFARGERVIKVEIKGIQGPDLTFNLTPKELWRAETDPHWVVVAVTSVLSPRNYRVNLVMRDAVARAPRVITGYRLAINSALASDS